MVVHSGWGKQNLQSVVEQKKVNMHAQIFIVIWLFTLTKNYILSNGVIEKYIQLCTNIMIPYSRMCYYLQIDYCTGTVTQSSILLSIINLWCGFITVSVIIVVRNA